MQRALQDLAERAALKSVLARAGAAVTITINGWSTGSVYPNKEACVGDTLLIEWSGWRDHGVTELNSGAAPQSLVPYEY